MTSMATSTQTFIPALRFDWLTRLYDPLIQLTTREQAFKRRLVEQARIAPGHTVLDVGCGTGTLALLAKEMAPAARVIGLDADPHILSIARAKVARSGRDVELLEGSATAPPLAPASVDRVLTTLMLHHLTTAQKREALAAFRRVLRPGAELHVADFGKPHNLPMLLVSLPFRFFDGPDQTAANLAGRLPAMIAEAGFVGVAETEHWMTPFGTIAFVRAATPP